METKTVESWNAWKARQMRRPAIEHMVQANGPAPKPVTCGFCKAYKFRKGEFRCTAFPNDETVWNPSWTGCGKFGEPPKKTDKPQAAPAEAEKLA